MSLCTQQGIWLARAISIQLASSMCIGAEHRPTEVWKKSLIGGGITTLQPNNVREYFRGSSNWDFLWA